MPHPVWHHRRVPEYLDTFHYTVFASEVPPVPVLPIAPRSQVIIGSIFKRGGYRSFANHVSAVKAPHIEAHHDWDQLLTHTAMWATRSVMRGIGPAHQSCSFASQKLRIAVRGSEP